jgi:hypothetical protein
LKRGNMRRKASEERRRRRVVEVQTIGSRPGVLSPGYFLTRVCEALSDDFSY